MGNGFDCCLTKFDWVNFFEHILICTQEKQNKAVDMNISISVSTGVSFVII